MANKSVIGIDIDDKQFKEFYELYKRYSDDLGEMPEAWKKVDEAARSSTQAVNESAGVLIESMGEAAGHAKNLGDYLRESIQAQKQLGNAAKPGETSLEKMAKSAKSVSESIFGLGKFLFKVGAIGGGILTGAGLFGLDKLANSAVANQRDARGLGLTTGQYRAFDTDFGRYLNPSILSSVADAKNSYTGRMWLARATGMDPASLEGMDSGDISGNLAVKAHDWWANTPAAQRTDTNLRSTGFAQSGLTMEDMRRLGATPLDQLRRAQSQYGADSGALNVGDRSTDALYGFSRQLTLAGQKLETVLTNKLSELGPAIGTLITEVEQGAEYLINDIFTESNMKAIASGLKTFATYLGSDDFKRDMQGLLDDIKQLGESIKWLVGLLPKPDQPEVQDVKGDFSRDPFDADKHPGNWTHPDFGAMQYLGPNAEFFKDTPKGRENAKLLAGWDKYAGLPGGVLQATMLTESSGNVHAVSGKGAQGPFQLMPDTAKQYGVTDPFNMAQSVKGASEYYHDLMAHYAGNNPDQQLRKSLAAYNWGQGNVDKDITQNGADWEKHVPQETENQIQKILAGMARINSGKQDLNITITNKSGTNVAMSVNAASK